MSISKRLMAAGMCATVASVCQAQTPCGVRCQYRLSTSVSGAPAASEAQINTTWLIAAPVVAPATSSGFNATGQFSTITAEARANYGECSLTASGSAQSGSGNGVIFWLDQYFGGIPQVEFNDRFTVSSPSLPAGTPVQLRFTLAMTGGATLVDINPDASFSGQLRIDNTAQGQVLLNTGIGTQSVVVNTTVGTNLPVYSGILATFRGSGVSGGAFNTASLSCNLHTRVTVEVLTAGAAFSTCSGATYAPPPTCGTSDFNGDGDFGTDQDIEAFFACLAGNCCPTCFPGGSDFNGDGDFGTDADIESFFRVLGGGPC